MTYRTDGDNWLVKFNKGELLIENLLKVAKEAEIKGAWVSGIGGALWAELGYYSLEDKQYVWQKFHDVPEITSLQGNVAVKDGEPVLHIHGTFSKADFSAVGGHVKELAVGGTCEVLLHKWHQEDGLIRSLDEAVGLPTLDV